MDHSYTVKDMSFGRGLRIWMLEDTPENRDRIIAEICRRAFEEVSD